jgi:hypothetical protein
MLAITLLMEKGEQTKAGKGYGKRSEEMKDEDTKQIILH